MYVYVYGFMIHTLFLVTDLLSMLEAMDAVPMLGPLHVVRARMNLLIAKACQGKIEGLKLERKKGTNDGKLGDNTSIGSYAACLLETLRELEDIQRVRMIPLLYVGHNDKQHSM